MQLSKYAKNRLGNTKNIQEATGKESQKAVSYYHQLEDKKKMIIEIRDSEQLNGEKSAFLHFTYNPDWITIVKSVEHRKYNKNTKEWEIPVSEIENIKEKIPDASIDLKKIKYDIEIPPDFVFKVPPLQHQKEAIEYGLNHPAFLNGDQQGLGKTYESLMTAEIRNYQSSLEHVLILCGVRSLQQNWGREISRFTNSDFCILGERTGARGGHIEPTIKTKLEDLQNIDKLPFYIITNAESLRNGGIADSLSDLCVHKIGMIIFDECHKCKNPRALTGKSLLRLNAKYKIALSGTPIVNNPMDAYMFLAWIGVEQRNYWQFSNYYQKYKEIYTKDSDGDVIKRWVPEQGEYLHLDEIQRKISHFMIRRLKEDVLSLPKKIYLDEYLEMGKTQRKLYEEVRRNMLEHADKIKGSKNPLTEFLHLREITVDPSLVSQSVADSVKLDRMEDIVEEVVKSGNKILIFSFYKEPLKEIKKRLKAYHPACISAETKNVEEEKAKFKSSTDVMIGTYKVMGTGHTLTEANTVLFLDLPWTSADLEQAEDRAHRIGQGRSVTYINLICNNTIDARLNEIVNNKKDLSDMLVDKKQSLSVDYLLK